MARTKGLGRNFRCRTEYIKCPACGKKELGTWEVGVTERQCVHCGFGWDEAFRPKVQNVSFVRRRK
jgi:Zn ribbon nucleic-acid-binding protein